MKQENDFGLLLTVLWNHKSEIAGRKRFQKIICILKHKYDIPFRFNFIPYYYGPYSEDLASTLDLLVSLGVVTEEKQLIKDVFQYVYKLSDRGDKLATSVLDRLDQTVVDNISSGLDEICEMSTSHLVRLSKEVLPYSKVISE